MKFCSTQSHIILQWIDKWTDRQVQYILPFQIKNGGGLKTRLQSPVTLQLTAQIQPQLAVRFFKQLH